jgi:carbon storage regulator
MLELVRRLYKSIHVGDDVVITVLRVEGDKVRLGIKAPRDVPVDREEVRKKKNYQPR